MKRFLSLLAACAFGGTAFGDDEPNLLWIVAEDMSPTLGCYDDDYAVTPNIDAFAEESVLYTNAYATAPVCSPARACLINGLSAAVQGTMQMRSVIPIPSEMRGFPAWLREAGYYTTNNEKTDYNSANADAIIGASWDESSETAHWRGRTDDEKPFFAVFNLMTSHQSRSMVWPYEQFEEEVKSTLPPEAVHDPAKAPIPPYYPDTEVIRETWARNYDCVTAMDGEVGAILAQLEEDGLADDTIVFFYSDHGTGLPGHKRQLTDSGMHVPLLVRFPEKYQDWAPGPPGSKTDRLVCFEDFGPTVMSLAGIDELPGYMEGVAFLGPLNGAEREYVFGHRDRVDEKMDLARSVRDGRYLYIRNYMPHLGWNQQGFWIDQGEIQHELYALAEEPEAMTAAQRHLAGPARAVEELYDCEADPMNLVNLAESADHAEVLERMRGVLAERLVSSRDLGFLPELELEKIAGLGPPYEWARANDVAEWQAPIIAAASEVGGDATDGFRVNLESDDPSVRYWGAMGFTAAPQLPSEMVSFLESKLEDDSPAVRIEVANALARHGHVELGLPVLVGLLEDENPTVVLYAARTIELLGEEAAEAHGAMQALADRVAGVEGDPAMFIQFTTSGYLNRVDPGG
ncbi:MAG: sulfatase-like hydrolase/transferase [Verrucomicrobiota bacterium]